MAIYSDEYVQIGAPKYDEGTTLKETQVGSAILNQGTIINSLKKVLEGINSKLIPILSSEPTGLQDVNKPEKENILCPLAKQISNNNISLNEIYSVLERIMRHIEL